MTISAQYRCRVFAFRQHVDLPLAHVVPPMQCTVDLDAIPDERVELCVGQRLGVDGTICRDETPRATRLDTDVDEHVQHFAVVGFEIIDAAFH